MAAALGFLGAVAALGVFCGGVFLGWNLCERENRGRVKAERLSEQEQRALREEQAAFRKLQNYSVEDAYGLDNG